MKHLNLNFYRILIAGLISIVVPVFSGQNASTQIAFDLNSSTSGNQGLLQIPSPGVGVNVDVEIRVIGATNLASFEVDIHYPKDDLTYSNVYEDNFNTSEVNILNTTGSVLGVIKSDDPVNGILNFSMASTDPNNAAACPDGDGLLALVRFVTKVASPGLLSFGDVTWVGHDDVSDECSEANKGGDASLPVQITQFTASASQKEGVTLFWQTQTEVNCAGFHVWKSQEEISGYRKITSTLIPGHGNTSTANMYSHIDKEVEDNVIYWYKIEELSTDGRSIFMGPVSAIGIKPVPKEFALSQNYPNPFNPETTFDYQLPEDTDVLVCIYNTLGKRVKTIVDKHQEAGYYTETWRGLNEEGRKVSSGIYLLSIETKEFHSVKKVSLMR